LTLLSIVGGVAAIVATYLASESAQLAQVALVRAVSGNAALEIEAAGGTSFDGKPLEPIAKLPGVTVASPVLRRYLIMTVGAAPDANDGPVVPEAGTKKNTQHRIQLLGVVPELDQQVRGYKLVAGENLNNSDSDSNPLLMDEGFARSIHVTVGSEVRFLTRSFVQTGKVVGLIKPSNASAGIQSGLIVAHLRMAQRWSRANGKLDAVQIVLDKNASLEKMTETIRGMLSNDLRVAPPQMRSQVAKESLAGPQMGLVLAMVVELILAVLIIYNTFQMNVGERRRTIGILRSMGTTRRQLLWMIVREGLWLGMVGTVLGCILGHYGEAVFRMSFSKFLQIEIPPSPLSIWPYLTAAVCGLTVSLLGAFIPALRASWLSPSEAMRVVSKGEFATNRMAWLSLGGVCVITGVLVQFLAIRGVIEVKHSVPALIPLLVGIILLIPAVLGDLTRVVEWALSFYFKTEA
jgi:putative ABC transport system permease protein